MVGTLIRRLPVIANPATDTAAGILETATQAEQETATAVDKTVTPGRQQYHPSSAKAWARFGLDGSILASYNVTSVTDDGVGNWTINIGVDFSSVNYAGFAFGGYASGTGSLIYNAVAVAAGTYEIRAATSGSVLTDPNTVGPSFFAFGDQ